MHRLMIPVMVLVLLAAAVPLGAEYIDGDQIKPQIVSKWSQWPDMESGVDVLCYRKLDPEQLGDTLPGLAVADDWRCTNGLPVTDFHWWGSYPAGEEGGVWGFGLFIHADVPATELIPSHPGQPLWGKGPLFVGTDVSEDFYATASDHIIYQYNYTIPDPREWFRQEEGQVYWLVMVAGVHVNDNVTQWGWHTAAPPFPENGIDAAVVMRDYGIDDEGMYSDWVSIYRNDERVQLAFELSTVPEPGTVALLGSGVLIFVGLLRRRRMSV